MVTDMATRWVNRLLEEREPPAAGVDGQVLHAVFDAIRADLHVPAEFPPEVLAEASEAVANPRLPERDETALPFFTVDPAGSKDLDQAMFLERTDGGYRVRYAIADVPSWVVPGGAIDRETRRRGQTIYAPDRSTPLHPETLSEDAASLLPGEVRPAFVWDLRLDGDGRGVAAEVYRAMVRSVERMDYEGVQLAVDAGTADERLLLLKEVGERRIALERARGGANLPMPEQEVTMQDGRYLVGFRPPVPAEDWNAQISLMTGMAAAEMMLQARVGILRTMPEPEGRTVAQFRQQARALGVTWREGSRYGEFLRSLDRGDPKHLALIHEATVLFRGAGYTPFDGELPEQTSHAAVAAAYAHVTAPLRRLVDRFGLVVCEALCRGVEVPAWARESLASLPEVMARSDRVAAAVDRASTDAVEVASLQHLVGQTFRAVVVDARKDGGLIQIAEPAILAPLTGAAPAGSEVTARLVEADLGRRVLRFELVSVDEPADPTEATEAPEPTEPTEATEPTERPEPTS
jgi:exoribonuclease R